MTRQINISDKTLGLDELVDSDVAARILGLIQGTIRDMAAKRTLQIHKIGSRRKSRTCAPRVGNRERLVGPHRFRQVPSQRLVSQTLNIAHPCTGPRR